ncbi:hypothetical protein EJ110_NYTH08050 [Nymphaea thermarum]|nr:hypothetical protein EJ110_NYTH08050 [Nymphaea thermarum]
MVDFGSGFDLEPDSNVPLSTTIPVYRTGRAKPRKRAENVKLQMKMQKQKDVAQALAHVLKEKLEMNKQRDDAIKEMEELRGEQAARTIRSSRAELEAATNNIDGSRIIGQRGVGTLYKGRSRHMAVAIKRLNVDHTTFTY